MDKLRKLQAEREKEEREAKLQKEEREAKLQAEKEQRVAEAKLKMEEMRTQLELAKIQAQASQQSEHNLTSGSTRSVHEGENSKFKMPKLAAFVDRKDDLDSWLLRFLAIHYHKWMAQGKLVYTIISTADRKSIRSVLSFLRDRGHRL